MGAQADLLPNVVDVVVDTASGLGVALAEALITTGIPASSSAITSQSTLTIICRTPDTPLPDASVRTGWLLPVTRISSTEWLIGPTWRDSLTACPTCLTELAARGYGPAPVTTLPTADATPAQLAYVAQQIRLEVTHLQAGRFPSATYPNRALLVESRSEQSRVVAVPKVPWCPDCGEARRHAPQIFHGATYKPALAAK